MRSKEIYRQRPDVTGIAHGHSPAVIPFGLTPTPMLATCHNAAFLAAGVPIFDIRGRFGATDILINTIERGAAVADALGDKPVVRLRAHGFVAVGPSIQAAVFRAVFTEISARVQLQASRWAGRSPLSMRKRGGWPTRSISRRWGGRGSYGSDGWNEIPLMDSPLSVNTKPIGERLAAILGRGPAVLRKAHGAVAVGAVTGCSVLAAYIEENAYRQYMAMQIGGPYVFSEAERNASRAQLWTASLFKKTWDHYRSKV